MRLRETQHENFFTKLDQWLRLCLRSIQRKSVGKARDEAEDATHYRHPSHAHRRKPSQLRILRNECRA
ncbi:MAG: hypothetical protein KatS3mg110_3587 [Pirellulaceae bacterium]|nr:MAG: hypothetical protein KatS3mg110_3587 [Pirellulaceae bacterium]